MHQKLEISVTPVPRLLTPGFVALLLTQTCFAFGFSSFFLLPKFLATRLNASAVEIGEVMGVFGVSAVVLILLVGVWIDRSRRRRFVTAGTLLMAFTSLGFLWVESVGPLVLVLRILQGGAFALVFIAASTLVADQAPPERLGQAIGIFSVAMLSMNAIAPPIVEAIAEREGWGPVFVLAALASLLSCGLSLLVPDARTPPSAEDEVPSLAEVVRRPGVLRFVVIVALVGASFGSMVTFHQPFALELGMTRIGGFFIAYATVALSVRLFLSGLADRAGRHRVSVLALTLYAIVVLWMANLRVGMLEWIAAAFGLAHGLFYPAFNALLLEQAGEHDRGKLMAIFNGSFNAGFSAGIIGLGFLAELAGYPTVFVVAAAGSFVGLTLLVTSPSARRRSRL